MTSLLLFCLLDGTPLSNAFTITISSSSTIHELKKAIKDEKPNEFSTIEADKLVIWSVAIPLTGDQDTPIWVQDVDEQKSRPLPVALLSSLFPDGPGNEAIHIIVQPLQVGQTQRYHRMGITLIAGSQKKFPWTINPEAETLNGLRSKVNAVYPGMAASNAVVVVHHPKQGSSEESLEHIATDDQLRPVLCYYIQNGFDNIKLDIVAPSLPFSNYTLKDVYKIYEFDEFKPLSHIGSATFETKDRKDALDILLDELEVRISTTTPRTHEQAVSALVYSFLVRATKFYPELSVTCERQLQGRRGHGQVDYTIEVKGNRSYVVGVVEVKLTDIDKGVAQNAVQLESTLTESDAVLRRIPPDSPPLVSYGIVSDASVWHFLECKVDHTASTQLTFRRSALTSTIDYKRDGWKEDAEKVFGHVLWLLGQMNDEAVSRTKHPKKQR
ncbi:hypothetical protein B0O80DRAFT_460327, partial [Mortierella sp. GBAus27b]